MLFLLLITSYKLFMKEESKLTIGNTTKFSVSSEAVSTASISVNHIDDFHKKLSQIRDCVKLENEIAWYKILAPNKVIEVHFTDGKKEKLVCHEEDTFDLRKGLYLAIAKLLYKDEYTTEGIEAKAVEIGYTKKYVKMVDKAIKDHNKLEELEKRVLEEEELERKKTREKRMRNDEKKREHKIEMQKEAYLRAMREFQEEKALASFE